MSYENIGTPTGNNLYITIPQRATKNWDENIKEGCFQKISDHDHTPGKGAAIQEAALDSALQTKLAGIATNAAAIAGLGGLSVTQISSQSEANAYSPTRGDIISIGASTPISLTANLQGVRLIVKSGYPVALDGNVVGSVIVTENNENVSFSKNLISSVVSTAGQVNFYQSAATTSYTTKGNMINAGELVLHSGLNNLYIETSDIKCATLTITRAGAGYAQIDEWSIIRGRSINSSGYSIEIGAGVTPVPHPIYNWTISGGGIETDVIVGIAGLPVTTYPSGVNTDVLWSSEEFKVPATSTIYDSATGKFQAPIPGYYRLNANLVIQSTNDLDVGEFLYLGVNRSTSWGGTSIVKYGPRIMTIDSNSNSREFTLTLNVVVSLTQGQEVSLFLFQNTGASVYADYTPDNTKQNYFQIERIG